MNSLIRPTNILYIFYISPSHISNRNENENINKRCTIMTMQPISSLIANVFGNGGFHLWWKQITSPIVDTKQNKWHRWAMHDGNKKVFLYLKNKIEKGKHNSDMRSGKLRHFVVFHIPLLHYKQWHFPASNISSAFLNAILSYRLLSSLIHF